MRCSFFVTENGEALIQMMQSVSCGMSETEVSCHKSSQMSMATLKPLMVQTAGFEPGLK